MATTTSSTTYKAATNYTADSMARKYGISIDDLQALNPGQNIKAGILKGVTINVPSAVADSTPVQTGVTPPPIAAPTQVQASQQVQAQNAADSLTSLFNSFGLSTLAPDILKMAQQGLGADSISLQLQQTDAYKQRFAANDARIKNGLNALTPAEYISTERAYRQVMSNAGLPSGFYDQQSDFQGFLEKDVSPTELQNRVNAATEAVNQAPSDTLKVAQQWYGIGDLVAYALDPTKATSLVEKRLKAAEAGALAGRNGTSVSQGLAEDIGAQGLSLGQMQQGFGDVGQAAPVASKLSQIYAGNVTSDDLVKEIFLNDATATNKVKGLASQERAAFSGNTGVGKGSFSTDGGQI